MFDNIVLFDTPELWHNLLPVTYTRPISEIRVGITSPRQKWEAAFPEASFSWSTKDYLSTKYPCHNTDTSLWIVANVIPTADLIDAVKALKPGQGLYNANRVIAYYASDDERIEYNGEVMYIDFMYHIFSHAPQAIRADFATVTAGRRRASVSESVTVIGDPSQLFIDETATVEGCIINVKDGPVYIGPHAEVMEGACMRGPISIGEHSVVKMGAKIYGGTCIGPWCKVGGELENVVMQAYSNKAHDGFLGNAVVGQWCNIGAGCVASNLKNDYTPIKLFNYPAGRFLPTGLQFCGVIMGDHTKLGINTMLNTATVLGVGVNIHGSGFPRPFVPSFSEGGASGFIEVSMDKFFDIARRMMARRKVELTDDDKQIFYKIRQISETYKQ